MKEKITEEKLVIAVKQMGGICPKFVSPGFNGMPDRLVLLPFGKVAFVEVKAPSKNLALYKVQGIDYLKNSVSRCTCLMMQNRLEG